MKFLLPLSLLVVASGFTFTPFRPAFGVATSATSSLRMAEEWSCDEEDCSVLIDPEEGGVKGATSVGPGIKKGDEEDEKIIARLLQEAKWNGNWDGDVWEPQECKLVWKSETEYQLVCKGDVSKLDEWKELLSDEDRSKVMPSDS